MTAAHRAELDRAVERLRNMPAELRSRPQWLLWRYERQSGDKKPRKVPYYANGDKRHGTQGSDDDRAQLLLLEPVLAELARGRYDGAGFAFLPGDGLIGIDLDGQVDDAGVVSARCQAIVQACASYTEWSPSGRGVHIIVAGQTQTFKDNAIGVEVFCGSQFFTCTGRAWPEAPAQIAPIAEQTLARLKATVKGRKAAGRPAAASAPTPDAGSDFARVNAASLALLDSWVPALMPGARKQGTGAWRVSSRELGRDLQEDLSLHPSGISDFGEERGLTPIDVVVKFGGRTPAEALRWLAGQIGLQIGVRKPRVRRKDADQAPPAAVTPPPSSPTGGVVIDASAVWQQPQRRGADGSARKPAVPESATHHDISCAWRDHRTIDGHAPKYTNGAVYAPCPSGLWKPQTPEQVQVEVAREFNGWKLCKKNSDFRQIADHIAALCEVEGYFDAAPIGVVSPLGFHQLGDTGRVETVPLTLAHRQTFALPYAPEYEAESPLLDGLLEHAFEGDDPEAQKRLWWQAVGATLFGLMPRIQAVLLLLGREQSGKSVCQRLLERIVPSEAVGAVSPASWGHEYHVAALAGKRINIVGELADDAPIPAAAFKNVTGQNLVAGRHPTHRPFSFRCLAAHWFASNVLPPTTDRSEAFYRRWRVLRFSNTVPPERVDRQLLEKIVAGEMPAIIAQAFLGAEEVAKAGGLCTTRPHDQVLDRWRLAANPLQQFLTDADWIELDPDAQLHGKPEVYEAYRRWSAACGFRNPFGRNHFAELLEATGATRGVSIKRVATREVVVGVRLASRSIQ